MALIKVLCLLKRLFGTKGIERVCVRRRRQKEFGRTGFDDLLLDGRRASFYAYRCLWSHAKPPQEIRRYRYRPAFFSKISLRTVAERIEFMSYEVEVHLI
jgi:hypothetical protein